MSKTQLTFELKSLSSTFLIEKYRQIKTTGKYDISLIIQSDQSPCACST